MSRKDSILGIDIDNTLTNSPLPWNVSYGDTIDTDIAKNLLLADERPGIEVLNKCEKKIVFVTARHEEYRNVTLKWFEKKLIKYEKIVMRNFRFSGGVFNLDEYMQYKYTSCLENNIKYMLDDDKEVVNMLNEHGIISVLVNRNGRFDTAYLELINKIE